MEPLKAREQYTKRLSVLRNERSTWWPHWREITDYVRPRRGRFLFSERNKGNKRNSSIINSTPLWALRTLAAGMQAGITSPARPWFRLTTPDQDLSESGAVRAWLDVVHDRMREAMRRSNIYNIFHGTYESLGAFGTACFLVEEDYKSIARGYPFPIGQYMLANSSRLEVDTVYREFSMTVAQLVEKFGLEACSTSVRQQYEAGTYDAWVEVLHVIEPNRDYTPGRAGTMGYQWKSCWMELAGEGSKEKPFLKESGYKQKPFCAPRWIVTAEDVYGESPAMDALGDSKAIQVLERRKAQAMDKVVNPPMRAPTSMMNQRVSMLPGDITYVDSISQGQTFAPAYTVSEGAVTVAREAIQEHAQSINRGLFADLWMAIMNGQGDPRKTATEVAAIRDEKYTMLGPVMERLDDELLGPVVEIFFDLMLRRRLVPPPPKELSGQPISVEYVSIMAQAQKSLGVSGKERLVGFVGNIAGARPEVLDKIDWDKLVDEYADDLGVKSNLIIPEDKVQAIRQERIAQQQKQQQMQQTMAAVQAAQTLSKTDTGGDNALTKLMGGLSPAAASAAGVGGVQ